MAACAHAACQSATAIVVDVKTDMPCARGDHLATTIAVGEPASVDQRPPSASATSCNPATGHIGSLVVVPSGSDTAEIAVRVVTAVDRDPASCDGAPGASARGCIVARRALRFIPHATIDLPIEMSPACDAVACPADQTCVQGECVAAVVPDPEQCALPAGCGDAGEPQSLPPPMPPKHDHDGSGPPDKTMQDGD